MHHYLNHSLATWVRTLHPLSVLTWLTCAWQIRTVPTNAQFYSYVFYSYLAPTFFRLTAIIQELTPMLLKTYSNKIVLTLLTHINIQIIVKIYSVWTVIKWHYNELLIINCYKIMLVFVFWNYLLASRFLFVHVYSVTIRIGSCPVAVDNML